MNLEERITNAVMEKLNDGTVEELVKKNVESAINKSRMTCSHGAVPVRK